MFKRVLIIFFLPMRLFAAPVTGVPLTEKLITQLLLTEQSFIISPHGVGLTLSMAAEGSGGLTKKEFANFLELPWPAPLHKNSSSVFESAQAAWVEKSYPVKDGYLDKLKKKYQADFKKADFKSGANEARENINAWVSEKTRGKITGVFPEGSLDAAVRLVLVNAVYFKDAWAQAFDPKMTTKRQFRMTEDETVDLETMTKNFKSLEYYTNEKFDSIQLPYRTKGFVMRIFLPRNFEISQEILRESLNKRTKHYHAEDVFVQVPKFKMDFDIDLTRAIKATGVRSAFDAAADFSKITPVAKADNLKIDRIQHKVFLDFNEEGTEAGAATAATLTGRSVPSSAKAFIVNRPFLYSLVRVNSKTSEDVLFFGYFKPPTEIKP